MDNGFAPSEITNKQPFKLNMFWKQNWTLLIGLLSVGFVSARLLGIAAGDPETAYAILQAEGTTSAVVGSLVPAIGLLIIPISIIALIHMSPSVIRNKKIDPSISLIVNSAYAIMSLAIVFTAPMKSIVSSILFTLVFTVLTWIYHFVTVNSYSLKAFKQTGKLLACAPSLDAVIAIYVLAVLASTALSSTPWLAPQNITMKDKTSFSAFILSQTDQTTFILTQAPTAVVELPSNQIVSTNICKGSNFVNQETINEWFGNFLSSSKIYTYPKCDPGYYSRRAVQQLVR